jgi:hypothetical protein
MLYLRVLNTLSCYHQERPLGYTRRFGLEVAMTGNKRTPEKDRLKDRSDIGDVEFPIEKLMEFRDASASCVHIEAAMEADRGLTDTGKKRPK